MEAVAVSLHKLLENPADDWSRPAYTQTRFDAIPGYSVRTDRWRYTEWGFEGGLGSELYGHYLDPHEMDNLAGESLYAPHYPAIETTRGRKLVSEMNIFFAEK